MGSTKKKKQATKKTKTSRSVYDVIQLSERRDANEPKRVEVAVNGEMFRCQRGVPVPLPRSHVKALKAARVPKYEHRDDGSGFGRQIEIGTLQRYPFETLFRDVGDAVYKELKNRSTKQDEPVTEDEIEALIAENVEFLDMMSSGKEAKKEAKKSAEDGA